tara:strand:+ start:2989 stop:3684 length:696 start_codon:yes stop_codon:yes gene_type:complete
MARANIFTPNTIELTLYRDAINGESMPLLIEGESVVGNTSPLDYIERLSKTIGLLRPELHFDAAYPDWVINQEEPMEVENGIVWSINKMLPVNLGGKPQPNPDVGTREVKPRFREDVFLEDGSALRIFAQKFTIFYQFDVFSISPDEAEKLTEWFQFAVMQHFGGLFGSHYTVFRQRLKDADVVKLNQKFNVRSLEYSVDLEQYSAIPESVVEAIKFNINIDENQSGYSQI